MWVPPTVGCAVLATRGRNRIKPGDDELARGGDAATRAQHRVGPRELGEVEQSPELLPRAATACVSSSSGICATTGIIRPSTPDSPIPGQEPEDPSDRCRHALGGVR